MITGVFKKTLILLGVLAVSFAQLTAYANAEDAAPSKSLNDIKFTDDMWEDTFLHLEKLEPVYLSKDIVLDIAPPPENDSSDTAIEFKKLFQYEKEARSPEVVEDIKRDQYGPARQIFPWRGEVSDEVLVKVTEAKNAAIHDMDGFLYALKRKYKRARPTQLAPELTTVIDIPKGPAYPSGHAAVSQMAANVYSYIDPAHEAGYMKFSQELSKRRAIAGIHYPSDCDAGRAVADQVFAELLKVPAYKALLDEAKAAYLEDVLGKDRTANFNDIKFREEDWGWMMEMLVDRKPVYLDPKADLTLPPPPLNDSEETTKELETLNSYADQELPEDVVKQIKYEAELGGRFDLDVVDFDSLSNELKQELRSLETAVIMECGYFLFQEKKRYARARPTQLDIDLTTLVEVPGHPAYPSAHAGQSRIVALALGYIDPAHKEEYIKQANDIGHRRELARVHYPSDTAAGIDLANRTFEKLLEVPAFRKRLDDLAEDFQSEVNSEVN